MSLVEGRVGKKSHQYLTEHRLLSHPAPLVRRVLPDPPEGGEREGNFQWEAEMVAEYRAKSEENLAHSVNTECLF